MEALETSVPSGVGSRTHTLCHVMAHLDLFVLICEQIVRSSEDQAAQNCADLKEATDLSNRSGSVQGWLLQVLHHGNTMASTIPSHVCHAVHAFPSNRCYTLASTVDAALCTLRRALRRSEHHDGLLHWIVTDDDVDDLFTYGFPSEVCRACRWVLQLRLELGKYAMTHAASILTPLRLAFRLNGAAVNAAASTWQHLSSVSLPFVRLPAVTETQHHNDAIQDFYYMMMN